MGAPPVHVAQRDHLTLCEREIRNRFLDMAADLVGQDALLGCPCSRRHQPRSSERMIRRMESRCIDIRGAHLVIATFTDCMRHRAVDQDAKHPRFHGGSTLEVAASFENRHPRLLGRLFGQGRGRHVGARESDHGSVVTPDELIESGIVTAANFVQERFV